MKKGAHYSFLITSNFISRTKHEIVGHFEIKGMTSVSFANQLEVLRTTSYVTWKMKGNFYLQWQMSSNWLLVEIILGFKKRLKVFVLAMHFPRHVNKPLLMKRWILVCSQWISRLPNL
jgi:hypothetical protein